MTRRSRDRTVTITLQMRDDIVARDLSELAGGGDGSKGQTPERPATTKAATAGPVTRAVQDVTGAAEALTVGAVQLTRHTLTAAVETVEDVGGRVGSLAVMTVRGAARAASDIGGDIGDLAKGTVQGSLKAAREIGGQLSDAVQKSAATTVDVVEEVGADVGALSRKTVKGTVQATREIGGEVGSLAVDAVEGTVRAIDRIGAAAGRSLREALAGTVAGVRTVLAEAGLGNNEVPPQAPDQGAEPARRPLARMTRERRPAPGRKSA